MTHKKEVNKLIELLPGDDYDIRCCEIYVTRLGFLLLHCSECDAIYESFSHFVEHLLRVQEYKIHEKYLQHEPTLINREIIEIPPFIDDAAWKLSEKYKCSKCACSFKYECQLRLHNCVQYISEVESSYPCSETKDFFQNISTEHEIVAFEPISKVAVSNSELQHSSECNLIDYNSDNDFENIEQEDVDEAETTDDENIFPSLSWDPKEDNENFIRPPRSIRARPFPCSKCKHQYCDKKLLEKHYDLYHSKERRYKCNVCEKAFTQKGNMTAHMRRHFDSSKSYECTICPSKFYTRKELTKHTWRHTGERPYICDECGKRFISNSLLKDHMKRHTNERPCKCSECDKSFYNVSLLRKHQQTHSSEYPHHCTDCDSKFKSRKTLKNHMKLHLNKREYVCNICEAAFNQKPALLLHRKGKHKIIPITASTDSHS